MLHLDEPVSFIKGVTPNVRRAWNALGIKTIEDLLNTIPRRYDDYSRIIAIRDALPEQVVTICGKIVKCVQLHTFRKRIKLFRATIQDSTGMLSATFFNQPWVMEEFKPGRDVFWSGKIIIKPPFGKTMASPIWEPADKERVAVGKIAPVYPLTGALTQKRYRQIMQYVLSQLEKINDPLNNETRVYLHLQNLKTAFSSIHNPSSINEAEQGRRRLAFDELLSYQLALAITKRESIAVGGIPIPFNQAFAKRFVAELPFQLTSDQKRVIWSALQDMEKSEPMRRLLQGDVGSGPIKSFSKIVDQQVQKRSCGLTMIDRLLGGGLTLGSVTLVGGEPGIGKSTLLSQIAIASSSLLNQSVLYVTGEESPSQVGLRLQRFCKKLPESLCFMDEHDAQMIARAIEERKPTLTIIDSIQSVRKSDVSGELGSPTQIKACASIITEAAKRSGVPVWLVGQVTKDGELAGPRLLEHIVDSVLMLEGDRNQSYRLLRILKHRFGSTDEVLVLEMRENGLVEVLDPSANLLKHRPENASGTVACCVLQGSRPMLVDVQALTSQAGYVTPARRVSGIDPARLSLLLAVMSRRAGISLHDQDVFANVVGGMDAREPATDLAVCLALACAKKNVPLAPNVVAWGEVGLCGEIRPCGREQARQKEAERMGFTRIIDSSGFSSLVLVFRALDLM